MPHTQTQTKEITRENRAANPVVQLPWPTKYNKCKLAGRVFWVILSGHHFYPQLQCTNPMYIVQDRYIYTMIYADIIIMCTFIQYREYYIMVILPFKLNDLTHIYHVF